jgi:hypothetical protein
MEATVPNENRLEGSLALLGVNLAPLFVNLYGSSSHIISCDIWDGRTVESSCSHVCKFEMHEQQQ